MKTKTSILALALSLILCLGLLPVGALAGEKPVIKEAYYYDRNPDPNATGEMATFPAVSVMYEGGSDNLEVFVLKEAASEEDARNDNFGISGFPINGKWYKPIALWTVNKDSDILDKGNGRKVVFTPLYYSNGSKPAEGETVSVALYDYDNSVLSDPVEITVPGEGGTSSVEVGEPDPNATYYVTVYYHLGAGLAKPARWSDYGTANNLHAGDTYSIPSPTYEGLVPSVAVVAGTIGSSDVSVDVYYRADSFKVTVLYYLGDGVTEAEDPDPSNVLGHYATGMGSLSNFNCSYDANDNYVPGREVVAEGLKNGASYSWTPPAYMGLRANPATVTGRIEGADVEVRVTYEISCTNPGGHHFVPQHDADDMHTEYCEYCGVQKAAPQKNLRYEPMGNGSHAVVCALCGTDLGVEDCVVDTSKGTLAPAECGGTCAKCDQLFSFEDHEYGDWSSDGSGHHYRDCSRCGYTDEQSCNQDKWEHQGTYPNGQHRKVCSVCGWYEQDFTNCTYHAEKTLNGYHKQVCSECGAGSTTSERCTYELTTTPTEHVYTCSAHCGNSHSGAHYRRSPVRENYVRPTVLDFGSYDTVVYCGRCGYEISRTTTSLPPKPWPEEKNHNNKLKEHFNSNGGAAIRRNRGGSASGGGTGGTGSGGEAYNPGGRMLENAWIDADHANVIVDGIETYMDENLATLLLPADDALNAYYAAHPDNLGAGWRIDLVPDVVISVTAYNEDARTLTLNVSATYGVYVTNTATGASDLIGENYPLSVDFPVELSFAAPTGIAEDGATLYVRNDHNGTYYYYNAAVSVWEGLTTLSFTAEAGFSVFEISPSPFPQEYYGPVEPAVEENVESGSVSVAPEVRDGAAAAEVTEDAVSEALETVEAGDALTLAVDTENAESVELALPAAAVQAVADADVELRVETENGAVKLSAGALDALAESGADAAVSVKANGDGTTTIDVTVGGEAVDAIVKVELPAAESGQVLVLVNPDGTEQIVKKSLVEDGAAYAELPAGATVKVVDSDKTFADVSADAYYADAVAFAASHELFEGTNKGFEPAATMDRAMLATVLYRLEDARAEGASTFADVPADAYYADAVAWADSAGIVEGTDAGFEPTAPVTRQQIAVMLYRYANVLGLDTSARVPLDGFSDGGETAVWAEDAMRWAVGVGLFEGDGVSLCPQGEATRAQVAVILQRMVGLIVK